MGKIHVDVKLDLLLTEDLGRGEGPEEYYPLYDGTHLLPYTP